jgi:hypothetical protein
MTFGNPWIFTGFFSFFNRLSPTIGMRAKNESPRQLENRRKKKPTAAKSLWARELLPDIESIALDCGHNAIIRFGRSADLKLFVTEASNIKHASRHC